MLETGLFIGLGALAIVIAFAIYKYSYAQGEYDNFLKSLSEDDQKEFALFTTTGKWRDYMRIHNQTMIERELERRDLLRRRRPKSRLRATEYRTAAVWKQRPPPDSCRQRPRLG